MTPRVEECKHQHYGFPEVANVSKEIGVPCPLVQLLWGGILE